MLTQSSNFVFLFETDISPETMDFGFGFNDSIHYYAGGEEVFPDMELDRSIVEWIELNKV